MTVNSEPPEKPPASSPSSSPSSSPLDPDERRSRILDAALTEFAEKGFHRASTNAIAERAGVAKGLVFHHFKSKDELFSAVVDVVFARMEDHFERTLADAPPEFFARLRRWTQVKLELMEAEPRLWRFWMTALHDAPTTKGLDVRQRSEMLVKRMLPKLIEGVDRGRIRPGVVMDDVVDAVWTLVAGWERSWTAAMERSIAAEDEGGDGGAGLKRLKAKLDRTFAILRAGTYADDDDAKP